MGFLSPFNTLKKIMALVERDAMLCFPNLLESRTYFIKDLLWSLGGSVS